jgi:hypothetical protein
VHVPLTGFLHLPGAVSLVLLPHEQMPNGADRQFTNGGANSTRSRTIKLVYEILFDNQTRAWATWSKCPLISCTRRGSLPAAALARLSGCRAVQHAWRHRPRDASVRPLTAGFERGRRQCFCRRQG